MAQKTALCIGLDQFSADMAMPALSGAVNDALLIGGLLREAGFDVRQLHNAAATRAAIVQRLDAAVANLRAGDTFLFWMSTAGYQIQHRCGDALVHGVDEAVCTYDTDARDPFTDDVLACSFARAHPEARLFIGIDACHSASVTRRRWQDLHQSRPEGDMLYGAPRLWLPPDDVRFRSNPVDFDFWRLDEDTITERTVVQPCRPVRRFGRLRGLDHPNHMLLTGAKLHQFSWEAHLGGQRHGAMTYCLAKAVVGAWKAGATPTYAEAHRQSVAVLAEDGFAQEPVLEGPSARLNQPVFDITDPPQPQARPDRWEDGPKLVTG